MEINKNTLILEDKIVTKNFGTIYFPTVQFLVDYGDKEYNKLLFPFSLTLDFLDIDEEIKKDIKVFDMFFQNFMYSDNTSFLDVLLFALEMYYKSKPIFNEKTYSFHIGNIEIHRYNFDELSEIILQINKSKKYEVEKPPIFENDVQKDIYFKILEGRRRKAQNNTLSFATIINVAMNCGNSYMSPYNIKQLTIYQLISRYEAILGIDNWNINFEKYLVGCDPKDLDLNYWINKVKI